MMRLSPIASRRLALFRGHKRGYYSAIIFAVLLFASFFAEFIANDKPLVVFYDGKLLFPIVDSIPETYFGGYFETETVYDDPVVQELINKKGWILSAPIPYSYDTISFYLSGAAPTAPDSEHWLGTDDEGRDVLARLIYGFRLSAIFGLVLTVAGSAIGILAGAMQGYYGGWVDLVGQRIVEIWSGLPVLFILIILAGFIEPNFFLLLFLMMLLSWTSLVGVVRAEVLRARNFEYVRAARSLGLGNFAILWRHVLPNAMVATITFLPFITAGAVTTLTSLDFLGYGLPTGSPSLGELLKQGKENLHAAWLGISAFVAVGGQLTLMVYMGEAVREAFDPRKVNL